MLRLVLNKRKKTVYNLLIFLKKKLLICSRINHLKLYFMETKKEKMLKKIQLIEEPKSEELLRKELEEALGGWNCGTYDGS